MSGNAWEWVSDWYDEQYYAHSPSTDPQGPKEGNVKAAEVGLGIHGLYMPAVLTATGIVETLGMPLLGCA